MKHLKQGHQQKVHIEGRRFSFHDTVVDNIKCANSWKKKFGGTIIGYGEGEKHIPYIIATTNSINDWSEVDDSDCQKESK